MGKNKYKKTSISAILLFLLIISTSPTIASCKSSILIETPYREGCSVDEHYTNILDLTNEILGNAEYIGSIELFGETVELNYYNYSYDPLVNISISDSGCIVSSNIVYLPSRSRYASINNITSLVKQLGLGTIRGDVTETVFLLGSTYNGPKRISPYIKIIVGKSSKFLWRLFDIEISDNVWLPLGLVYLVVNSSQNRMFVVDMIYRISSIHKEITELDRMRVIVYRVVTKNGTVFLGESLIRNLTKVYGSRRYSTISIRHTILSLSNGELRVISTNTEPYLLYPQLSIHGGIYLYLSNGNYSIEELARYIDKSIDKNKIEMIRWTRNSVFIVFKPVDVGDNSLELARRIYKDFTDIYEKIKTLIIKDENRVSSVKLSYDPLNIIPHMLPDEYIDLLRIGNITYVEPGIGDSSTNNPVDEKVLMIAIIIVLLLPIAIIVGKRIR